MYGYGYTSSRMDAVTLTVGRLSTRDAAIIASSMTKAGSEFQQEVLAGKSKTPIAIIRDMHSPIIAWTATHEWDGMQTIEGFTSETYRRRGLARLGAAMLVAEGSIDTNKTTAVFAPYCVEIARSVGCRDVRLYERHGDGWVENS